MLAGQQGAAREVIGGAAAADGLHDQRDLGIALDLRKIGDDEGRPGRLGEVPDIEDIFQLHRLAHALFDQGGVGLQDLRDARTDGAEP